jgi:peptidoglycan/LPS O-acetylase OafA/YrhL
MMDITSSTVGSRKEDLTLAAPGAFADGGVSPSRAGSGAGRVAAIDGLRGIAALLVVFYHLHEAISRSTTGWLWAPVDWVARNGFLGVDIFFVISGFVIALSVSKGDPTPSYFGRFVLRRSIRLDPPYWSAILLELLLLHATLNLFPGISVKLPSTPQLLSHLIYSQELLGYGSVVPVFWTLCYEIQFYAFFVGLVVAGAMLPARMRAPVWAGAFWAALFLLSLWTRYWRPAGLPSGLAIDRWFQFFIGVLTYRAVTGADRMSVVVGAWITLAVTVALAGASAVQLLAILVSMILVTARIDRRVSTALSVRPLRFLGAISYSLYLYHSSVGWRFVSLVQKIAPGTWQPPFAILVYVVGIAGSIGFATLLWMAIERPCLRLCQRVRLPLRRTAPASPQNAAAVIS